ncbi:MAG TPA: hypothetical protein ENN78_00010 [Candidatus Omnitrophica bacterium]|nr:hypothetical protein [Candidatus Omnitrophota bacterium]
MGKLFLLLIFVFQISVAILPGSVLNQPAALRRVHTAVPDYSKIAAGIAAVMSDADQAKICCQYGLTLGDMRLRTQIANLLNYNIGIQSNPEKNIAVFHNVEELFLILALAYIEDGDVVLTQGSSEKAVDIFDVFGAGITDLADVNILNGRNFDGVKLVYISDSSVLSQLERESLIELASKHNFLIVERTPSTVSYGTSLKSMEEKAG